MADEENRSYPGRRTGQRPFLSRSFGTAAAVALAVIASSALAQISGSAAAEAPAVAPESSPPPKNKPMKMNEPMRGEMKKEGMMKRDVKDSMEKWGPKMDDMMDKEEKEMTRGNAKK